MSSWMYSTPLWRKRRLSQLRHKPLCEMCIDRGDIVEATTVHHVERHEGDWEKFISSPLQSLCKRCHDSRAQSIERLGYDKTIGVDGWPIAKTT